VGGGIQSKNGFTKQSSNQHQNIQKDPRDNTEVESLITWSLDAMLPTTTLTSKEQKMILKEKTTSRLHTKTLGT
jgi:hypothetical protein